MLIQYLINVKLLCVAYSPRPDEVMIVRYVQPLTDEQRALLEKTMKEDTAFRARSRAHSLLLSAAGTPIQTIAKTYQVHRVTVSAWITKWERHGAQSLHDHPRSGRPPKLTPDEQELAQHYMNLSHYQSMNPDVNGSDSQQRVEARGKALPPYY